MMSGRKGVLLAILVVVSLMLTHSLSGQTLKEDLNGQTVKGQSQQSQSTQPQQPQSTQLQQSQSTQPQQSQSTQPQQSQSTQLQQSQSTQLQHSQSTQPKSQSAQPQQGEIYRGQLRDRVTEEPISMATVILLSADSTVLSTTLSSDGGTFELSGVGRIGSR